MSAIKSKNTTPEKLVRSYLHKKGFRFRLKDKTLPCSPDLILRKYNSVIFVHGCFWHNHDNPDCKSAHIPKSNINFWKNKLEKNILRDKKNINTLHELGWNVLTIWECEIKNPNVLDELIINITSKTGHK